MKVLLALFIFQALMPLFFCDVKIQIDLPKDKSELSDSEASELKSYYDWKNSFTRYDEDFNYVEHVYSPEKSYYEFSVQFMGMPFYLIAAIIFFFLLVFMIGRFVFGFFGGRRLKKESLPKKNEMRATWIFVGIGIALWFSGMVVGCIGGVQYTKDLVVREDSCNLSSGEIDHLVTHSKSSVKSTNVRFLCLE